MAGYVWKGTHQGPDLFDATEPPPRQSHATTDVCGTPAGFWRHYRRHEPACKPCTTALNNKKRLTRAKTRQGV